MMELLDDDALHDVLHALEMRDLQSAAAMCRRAAALARLLFETKTFFSSFTAGGDVEVMTMWSKQLMLGSTGSTRGWKTECRLGYAGNEMDAKLKISSGIAQLYYEGIGDIMGPGDLRLHTTTDLREPRFQDMANWFRAVLALVPFVALITQARFPEWEI